MGVKTGEENEKDERKNKIIRGIVKTCLEQLTGLDNYKYCDVCSAEYLSAVAYLASESGCR
jgi:predicted chitinase